MPPAARVEPGKALLQTGAPTRFVTREQAFHAGGEGSAIDRRIPGYYIWRQSEMSWRPGVVFLDRDGTIARDVHYCRRVEDFEILPTVPEAIRLLNDHGFRVVVITNQSGVARGYFTEDTLSLIHQKMRDDLAAYGARIDAVYYCPHHPDENCKCRKPEPALLFRAAAEMGIELGLSYMVGDDRRDVEAGKAAGCRTVLVTTGPNAANLDARSVNADYVASSLYQAAEWIVPDVGSREAEALRTGNR